MISEKKYHPPRIAKSLLQCMLIKLNRHSALGDFEEIYNYLISNKGISYANIWYRYQTLKSIPSFLINSFEWGVVMFRNYLKITWRNLLKQKMYSIITISGLAIGLGTFLFFLRFYIWAITADSFHKDIERIYNIVQVFDSGNEGERHTAYIPSPLGPAIKNEIPEVEDFTRIYDPGKVIVSHEEKRFFEYRAIFIDANFTNFFTFNTIEGNARNLLPNLNSVVITQSMATKYFGDESPIGKVLNIDNRADIVVTAVVQDVNDYQSSSSLYYDFLIPLPTARKLFGEIDNWESNNITGFVRLQKGFNNELIENKLELIRTKYFQNSEKSPKRFYLFPTKAIKFNAPYIQKFSGYDSFVAYTLFLILGFLFLLIVIFNYVNLSTARYTDRLKEVGVRKVVGANKYNLFNQFLGESVLLTLLALPFGILTYNIVSRAFSVRVGITFNIGIWSNETIILLFISIAIITGIGAGIYPAFFLSSFKPVQILKGKFIKGKSKGRMRRLLVISQFSFSIILIVLAIVWQKQTFFLQDADLGYNRDGIICVPLSGKAQSNLEIIQEKLKNYRNIQSVTASTGIPGGWETKEEIIPEGFQKRDEIRIYSYGIDYDFLETLNIPISLGRSFSKQYQDENNFIVNQMFVDRMGWENPVGKTITMVNREGTVVGVSKNFHFANTFYPMGPAIFFIEKDQLKYLHVKTDIEKYSTVTEIIKAHWHEFSPNIPFEVFTLNDYFNRKYFGGTQLVSDLFIVLGTIAIFFSCLGLLALSSYAVRQRTKEMGIRKVLGASVYEILLLLAKDFLKLIIIANVIALPIAYYGSKSLLEFASTVRTTIGWSIFLSTSLITIIISIIAITTQTYKAANNNPVNSLRYE